MLEANSTVVEEHTTAERRFGYFSLLITLFILFPGFVANLILILVTVIEKSIPPAIRFILANILSASEVVIIGIAIILMQNVVTSANYNLNSSIFVCQLSYVSLTGAAAARLLFMATFAVSVYVLVSRGMAKLKLWPTVLAGLFLWLFAIVPNAVLFSPKFLEINLHDGTDCAAHGVNTTTIIYTFSYIAVYGCCSFTLGIVFPILTICYIKKNTISDNTQMLKGMIKFAVFLLIGNGVNLVGTSIPLLFATFAPSGDAYYTLEKAFNYSEGILLILSLIPTPIILLIFFKPIRMRVKSLLCYVCLKSEEKKEKVSPSSHTKGTGVDSE